MSSVSLKQPIQEVESILHRFYFNVLYRNFKLESTDFIQTVKKSLRDKFDGSHKLSQEYVPRICHKEAELCAYTYEFSVLHSAVVIYHFLELLKCDGTLIERLVSSEQLEICCLGGRSIPEAIGVCKIVSDLLEKHKKQRSSPLVLKITVVSLCEGWSANIWKVLKLLKKDPDLCNPAKIKLILRVLQGDWRKFDSKDVIKAVRRADFIAIVKFISELILPTEKTGLKSKTIVHSMMKEIFRNMKDESYLFFLDNSEGGYYNIAEENAELYSNCKLKQARLHELYTLNIDSIRQEMEYLYHTFGNLCETYTIASSGTWKKVKPTGDIPSRAKHPVSKIHISSNSKIEDILRREDQKLIEAHELKIQDLINSFNDIEN